MIFIIRTKPKYYTRSRPGKSLHTPNGGKTAISWRRWTCQTWPPSFKTRITERSTNAPKLIFIKKLTLTAWYNRLGHLNFSSLKKHLRRLNINIADNSENYVCDSYQRAKANKVYNRHEPQRLARATLEFVHTGLVGPIRPIGFGGERYSFTRTYTETKKRRLVSMRLSQSLQNKLKQQTASPSSPLKHPARTTEQEDRIMAWERRNHHKTEFQNVRDKQSWTWLEQQSSVNWEMDRLKK